MGNGGTYGSLGTGAVTNYGTLVFDRSDAGLTVSSGNQRQRDAGSKRLRHDDTLRQQYL